MHLIPLDQIRPNPWQTRQGEPDPEYIKSLALDIAKNGLMQTPIGRISDTNLDFLSGEGTILHAEVQLAFGHNRLAAYKWLRDVAPHSDIGGDWSAMPVELRDLSDEQMADDAWSENEQRRDVDPVSRARAIEKRLADFNWTHEQAAVHLGISRPTISNLLRLLKLPQEIQDALAQGKLSERQAGALLSLYELPGDLRSRAQNNYYTSEIVPSNIVKAALDGLSSDEIRSRIDRLANQAGQSLDEMDWQLQQAIDIAGVQSPKCSECSQRLAHGKRGVCLDPKCFRLKQGYYWADYLLRASQASGIPVMEKELNSWSAVNDFHLESDKLKQFMTAACPNLRLRFMRYSKGDDYRKNCTLQEKGFPDAEIICAKQSQFCTCRKGLEALKHMPAAPVAAAPTPAEKFLEKFAPEYASDGEGQPGNGNAPAQEPVSSRAATPTAEELKELAKQANRARRAGLKQIGTAKAVAKEIILRSLLDDDPGAWRLLLSKLSWRAAQEARTLEEMRASVAAELVEKIMPWQNDSLESVLRSINGELQKNELAQVALNHDGVPVVGDKEGKIGKTLAEVFSQEERVDV